MEKENIHAEHVANFLLNHAIVKFMKEFIQVKSHTYANFAIKHFLLRVTLNNMRELFTQAKNHFNVDSVIKDLLSNSTLKVMDEFTQKRNHINAKIA